MSQIKSEKVKNQLDYSITMQLINNMLSKNEVPPVPGSILIGKKYANSYKTRIDKMLICENIDTNLLEEMQSQVQTDLKVVKADTAFRGFVPHARDNSDMMHMILDFILSID
jgi:hypothetical protein